MKWAVGSGQWAAGRPHGRLARTPATAHCPLPTAHFRRGLTLVELLITMVIIAIISAAILGTAAAAMENARRKRTQVLITRIHTLVTERLASYEGRRIDIHPNHMAILNNYVQSAPPAQRTQRQLERGQIMADLRLLGVRELMKYEMPDRWLDFIADPVVLTRKPALTQVYHRRWLGLDPADTHQGAECLYLTVMSATGDGEARTLFSDQDIGDVDEDGMPEILDGWGQPISWLRWPSGFVSELQPVDSQGNRPGEADHDPFDMYRRDQRDVAHRNPGLPGRLKLELNALELRNNSNGVNASAYRLAPLMYSSGPDGISDIWAQPPNDVASLDPYRLADGKQLGLAFDVNDDGDENFKDNIHNHSTEY